MNAVMFFYINWLEHFHVCVCVYHSIYYTMYVYIFDQ